MNAVLNIDTVVLYIEEIIATLGYSNKISIVAHGYNYPT